MMRFAAKLSPKERRLAYGVLLVVIAVFGYSVVNFAVRNLASLDEQIEQLEDELYQLSLQAKRMDDVNRAYSLVTEQHSSEWTQAEIHDRLRTELLRLAMVNMPPPGSLPSAFSGDRLVEIPSWPAGTLDDQGEGFREYHIRVTTKPARIQNIALFLKRIHESPQILRVDRLELVRPSPESSDIVLTMTVTRTIIGDTPSKPTSLSQRNAADNLAPNAGLEEWDSATASFPNWQGVNMELKQTDAGTTEGSYRLEGTATQASAELYQVHLLRAGQKYEWRGDIAASGTATLVVAWGKEKSPLSETVTIEGDNLVRRYRIAFAVPPGQTETEIYAPLIMVNSKDTTLFVDNTVLIEGDS